MTAPAPLDQFLARGRTSLRTRLGRLRDKGWQVGQCAVAAGAAWWLAADVLDHTLPFFAPIAAVVALGTSYGQRLRRVAEVTVGVALGVFVGDLLTHLLGAGAWQMVLIVSLAMSTAVLLDAGAIIVTQAGAQAIIVTAFAPAPGAAFTRWTDAVIGGVVALVAAAVVPQAPLRRPGEKAGLVVRKTADLLRAAADSIEDGDVERAVAVLADARATDYLVADLEGAAREGLSVVASSPFRLRHKGGVREIAGLIEPLDRALRSTRVLVRRVAVAAYRREPLPAGYAVFARDLADVVDLVAGELAGGHAPTGAQQRLVELGAATSRLPRTEGLSAAVVLAQFRSIIADLLAVAGMDPFEATDAIPPLEQE